MRFGGCVGLFELGLTGALALGVVARPMDSLLRADAEEQEAL